MNKQNVEETMNEIKSPDVRNLKNYGKNKKIYEKYSFMKKSSAINKVVPLFKIFLLPL